MEDDTVLEIAALLRECRRLKELGLIMPVLSVKPRGELSHADCRSLAMLTETLANRMGENDPETAHLKQIEGIA